VRSRLTDVERTILRRSFISQRCRILRDTALVPHLERAEKRVLHDVFREGRLCTPKMRVTAATKRPDSRRNS
jgi:hypothetical protein